MDAPEPEAKETSIPTKKIGHRRAFYKHAPSGSSSKKKSAFGRARSASKKMSYYQGLDQVKTAWYPTKKNFKRHLSRAVSKHNPKTLVEKLRAIRGAGSKGEKEGEEEFKFEGFKVSDGATRLVQYHYSVLCESLLGGSNRNTINRKAQTTSVKDLILSFIEHLKRQQPSTIKI